MLAKVPPTRLRPQQLVADVVPARRCYKFDIKFNFSGFPSRTFILFDFTLHRQLVC